jgi:hypothetical protein
LLSYNVVHSTVLTKAKFSAGNVELAMTAAQELGIGSMANGCPKAFIRVDKKSLSRATTDKLTWLGVPWNVPNSFPYVSKEEATALLISNGIQSKLLLLSFFFSCLFFTFFICLASSFHLFSVLAFLCDHPLGVVCERSPSSPPKSLKSGKTHIHKQPVILPPNASKVSSV